MADEIFFDGVKYIPASCAGREANLTRDYIARLCRDGKICGKQVGKVWYVSEQSLKAFLVSQEFARLARREALSERRVQEYKTVHDGKDIPDAGTAKEKENTFLKDEYENVKSLHSTTHTQTAKNGGTIGSANVINSASLPVRVRAQTSTVSAADTAVAGNTLRTVAAHIASSPVGASDALLRLAPHFANSTVASTPAIAPAVEIFHKLTALVVAVALTFGTYSLVDARYARYAMETIESAGALITDKDFLAGRAMSFRGQLAAAAMDPGKTFSSAASRLARSLNNGVNNFVYAISFGDSLNQLANLYSDSSHLAIRDSRAAVTVQIDSYKPASATSSSRKNAIEGNENNNLVKNSSGAAISQPVAERILETQRIISAGGISEDILNQRLQQLDNKLSSQMFSISAANSTQVSQTYQVISQTNKIDQLNKTAISNATISNSSYSGGSVSADTLSVSGATTLAGTTIGDLSVTGNLTISGTSATSTFTNGIQLSGGCFRTADGTCLSGAGASLSSANTWTSLQLFQANASSSLLSVFGKAYFGGSATSTFDSAGNLSVAGTLGVTGNTTLANATTTNLFSTTASSTNLFSQSATLGALTANSLSLNSALGVGSGGTGATTFSQGWLFSSGGTGALSASSSPTVNYITATSTTATSTFSTGGLAAGTSQFVVQQTSGRIGVGTAAPTTGLDVRVSTNISGDLTLSGGGALTISATGPVNQTGTGQVTFAGNVDATNGLDVTNADFTVGGSKFSVAQSTGNTIIAGTLAATGAVAASSTLQTTGASRFYSTLRVDGALTAAGSGTGLSVTNNATIGGTLSLTGAGTFGSSLDVTGTLSAATTTLSGNLVMSSKNITGLANPSADQDAVNKTYVDSVASGLSLKDSVRAGTTANITLSGEQTIDGVAIVSGNRVLVKNQSDQTKNGIYVASSGSWSRSTDADASNEVSAGMFTFISEGTLNANSGWVMTTANPITLGTSLLAFSQFSGAGQITAGTGLTKTGNSLDVIGTASRITANADSIDIASNYVGQTSITTVGALTSGSLGSGFGNINIGASSITGGVATFSAIVGSAITGSGNLTINGAGTFTSSLDVSGTLTAATTSLSGNLVMNSKKITGLADPTSAQEAATKAYVDAIAQGLTVKASVRAATTANITLSGTQTVDGVSLIAGDRVLVKDQSTASANGIYVVASGAWSRSTDADENSEVAQGMYTFVTSGTTQANTGWSLITGNPITLNTTSLTFTQFSGTSDVIAGDGLTKSGTTINVVGTANRISVTSDAIDISSSYVGQSTITTVGALASGSIASGFGAINIGTNALTAGASIFSSATSYGTLSIGGTATTSIVGNSATSTFSGGISLAGGNLNLATGGALLINNALALNATTLGSSIVGSSLTSVGALSSGSLIPGFGAINIGSNTLDAGNTTLTNATTTNLFSTTASSTNLFSQNATLGALTANSLSLNSALTVANGGTGATTFGQGWLFSSGGTGALSASTSPTVNYLTATSTTATSTFAAGIQSTYLNITGTSATSTFANGIQLSAGCFRSADGTCAGSATPGGSNTQVQYNNNGALGASANFTFNSTSNLLTVTNASTTLFSSYGPTYFGATATSSFSSAGALTLTGITNSLLSANGSGVVGATTTPTAQYFIATSTSLASTFPYASSTALTVSGTGYFGNGSFTGTTGTTTIASGQGFTIGSTQLVLQQGSGNLGIGTAAPGSILDVLGTFHLGTASSGFTATGGTITSSGGYTIHTFTSSGTFTPTGSGNVEVLVVAGGGGGGLDLGGGGGAGGYTYNSALAVTAQAYTVTVGAGGAGSTAQANTGAQGGNSVFSSITSTGGGGGKSRSSGVGSSAGGSGGGGSYNNNTAGLGTAGQGNDGGTGTSFGNGGGGGAGAVGNNASGSVGGAGGAGTANSISGSSVTYAGGGGGGGFDNAGAGAGGTGGGGAGCTAGGCTPTNGTANTGGGGGGQGGSTGVNPSGAGGAGGSGIVIVRYPSSSTVLQTTSGGFVGIGTTTPLALLDIAGVLGAQTDLFNISSTTATNVESSLFRVAATGNVGIATTTPGSIFSVQGVGNFVASATSTLYNGLQSTYLNITGTSATSTFARGINLGGGCFSISGTCVGGGASLTTANTWTALQQFQSNASTTQLSAYNGAYFGGSATSSFSSAGALTLASALAVGSGGTGATTLTGLLQGNGTSAITAVTGTAGQLPYFNGASTLLATSSIYLATSGNVGIGTTTPSVRLEVVNTSSGATADQLYLTNLASATSTASRLTFRTQDLTNNTGTSTASITSILQQNFTGGKGDLAFSVLNAGALTEAARFSNAGYFGIGTTSPFRKLSITDTVTNAQVAIAYDATRAAEMRIDTNGDLNIAASGNDTFLNNDNFWVCTGGSITTNGCPSGTPTGQGNIIVENKEGIGTTTPAYKLSIETQDSTTNFLQIASTTSQALFVVNSTGNVGIGTTTPSAQLALSNLLYVGAGGTTGMGTATSTFYGDIKIIGKLDVGTIDPVYTIDGTKYATYGHSTVGVKEETLQTINLDTRDEASGKYVYAISFDRLEKGTDLWLFYQVTDFGENWNNLVVSLTPSFDGSAFYKKIPEKRELLILADSPGEISMRLSANRFDYMKWPNLRPDQDDKNYKGFEISSKTSLNL